MTKDAGQPVAPSDATPVRRAGAPRNAVVAWSIGPVFLLLALWLAFVSPRPSIPPAPAPNVSRQSFAPGAPRDPMGEPPQIDNGGYEHACSDCHRLFTSPRVEPARLMQHTSIVLNHGLNNQCFNCHDRDNRDRLTLYDGTLIGFDQVPRLCAECHGTVFRDWQLGMHGKTLGSWEASSGKQRRLACNECHDPHAPAYPPYKPLPPPNTMRMGNQSQEAGGQPEEARSPLRRWSSPAPADREDLRPPQKEPRP